MERLFPLKWMLISIKMERYLQLSNSLVLQVKIKENFLSEDQRTGNILHQKKQGRVVSLAQLFFFKECWSYLP
jgi:hypothetical protein